MRRKTILSLALFLLTLCFFLSCDDDSQAKINAGYLSAPKGILSISIENTDIPSNTTIELSAEMTGKNGYELLPDPTKAPYSSFPYSVELPIGQYEVDVDYIANNLEYEGKGYISVNANESQSISILAHVDY